MNIDRKMSSTYASASLLGNEMSRSDHQKFLQQNPLASLKEELALHQSRIQINYQGRLSVVQASGQIFHDVEDSGDDGRESASSPYNKTSSEDPKDGSDSDGLNENGSEASLQHLQRICSNKSFLSSPGSHKRHDSGGNYSSGYLDSSMEGEMEGGLPFHCHICSYECQNRDDFNNHLNNHYDLRCPKCDFSTKIESDYKTHLASKHNLTPDEVDDDQGALGSRGGSQGKAKSLKCKLCDFVTITKEEFWKHTKAHIKPEKMLSCPKCSFVTEFKHHLEYHLRNHYGSKPFKCPQCSYSCVNKSMLNSHMKSHTAVYQYRCADCNYATKYCHSLKLHLRKYRHNPDMVLNPDGTPNPLPIVDVYGTRRGPKVKRDEFGNVIGPVSAKLAQQHHKKFQEEQQKREQKLQKKENTAKNSSSSGLSPLLNPYVMAQMTMHQLQTPTSHMEKNNDSNDLKVGSIRCSLCSFETTSHDVFRNHMILHASRGSDLPIESNSKLTPSSNRNISYQLEKQNSSILATSSPSKDSKMIMDELLGKSSFQASDYLEYLKRVAPLLNLTNDVSSKEKSLPVGGSPLLLNPFLPGISNGPGLFSHLYLGSMVKNLQQMEASNGDVESNASSGGALDLTQQPDVSLDQSNRCSSASSNGKSRRKGRAYKIEQKSNPSDPDSPSMDDPDVDSSPKGDDIEFEDFSGGIDFSSPLTKSPIPEQPVKLQTTTDEDCSDDKMKLSGQHICQPCKIAFMDSFMYSCHVECHHDSDPFKCIKCDVVLSDAREFFLHLIQEAHL